MKRAFSLSSLIHLGVFLLMIASLPKGCGGGSGAKSGTAGDKTGQEEKSVQFTQSSQDDGTIEILSEGEVEIPAKKEEKAACLESFGGIGVQMNGFGQVTEVPEWYPAYKAGIRLGDLLTSNSDIRGEPGTFVMITVIRNNQELTFLIKRATICYRTEKEKK